MEGTHYKDRRVIFYHLSKVMSPCTYFNLHSKTVVQEMTNKILDQAKFDFQEIIIQHSLIRFSSLWNNRLKYFQRSIKMILPMEFYPSQVSSNAVTPYKDYQDSGDLSQLVHSP